MFGTIHRFKNLFFSFADLNIYYNFALLEKN